MAHSASYSFPIGSVTVGYEDDAVVSLKISPSAGVSDNPSLFSDQVAAELQEYFQGKRTRFTFPLRLDGTDFQKAVWQELLGIPYGQTRTYGNIAREMARITGKEKMSAQAVGQAVGSNPISIIIPCHRVVGERGKLTGYAWGIDKKLWLLRHEEAI